MACLIGAGIARVCGFSFGGLKTMYIASKDNVTAIGKDTTGTVTGITMSGSTKFLRLEFEPDSAQLLQELQTGSPSRFINQTVSGQFANISQAKKVALEAIANSYATVIVQDQSGAYYLAGEYGRGLLASALTIDSGKAEGDGNVATMTLIGGSLGYANQVLSTVVTAHI